MSWSWHKQLKLAPIRAAA